MLITADAENFRPENFEILNFYGIETCFAWQKNLFVAFPYVQTVKTAKLPLIVAPREIKSFRCFNERVYILCKPAGIYKFKDHKFTTLSNTAIGIGPLFYQVYSPENDTEDNPWLHLKNKDTLKDKQLFPLRSTSDPSWTIYDLTLDSSNSNYALRRSLHLLEDGADEDICIITNGRKVFKITQRDVRIVYRADQEIIGIVGIKNSDVIVGFVLVTTASTILAYLVGEKLTFDKIYLDTEVRGICAGTNGESSDTIWIVHSDGTRIYYSIKTISTDTFRRTKTEEKLCFAIRNYKNNLVLLSDNRQLLECPIDTLELGNEDTEEFVDLRADMLQGTEQLVETICESAVELQALNENILEEREKLKRINVYAHNQPITHLNDVRVLRVGNEIFLRIKFDGILPKNCHVIAVFRSDMRTTYCTKLVEDSETVVDVPVDQDTLDSSVSLGVDLVTFAEESRAWCLIRDYTKDPEPSSTSKIHGDRTKFLQAKLAALRNLTAEGNLDMKKLSNIKKSIRRELRND